MDFTFWDILYNLLLAFRWTVGLSLIAFFGGGVVGIALLIIRLSQRKFADVAVSSYVQIVQGTPLLMQLFLTYFGLAMLGLPASPMVTASFCLTLYASAYLTEIWRGSVNAVSKDQWEASASLALNFKEQLRHIIIPQAKRMAIAPTVGFMVQVIKNTALASVIGFVEVTRAGQIISNTTYQPFLVYGCVAILYFLLCFPLSVWSRHLEKTIRL